MPRPRFSIQHLLALTTVVAISVALCFAVQKATSTRTIVAIDLPENKRVRLIQTFGGEPFDTKFYFDAGDGRWGFYYYEHEDWYWNEAGVETDGNTLSITRGGRCTIKLNTQTGFCVVERADGWRREYEGPVEYRNSVPGSIQP